ncbi:MAG: hypothetical protein IT449_13040 [Phycisphaerales bacterium]|nr:hypothetical protein [Phycisphaerales bacterium]
MPMVARLGADDQAKLDRAWEHLIAHVTEADRTLLLDAMIVSQMYQIGVDQLDMVSVKRLPGGQVTMRVRFDRLRPEGDRFSFTYADARTRVLREESFEFGEVAERYAFLYGGASLKGGEPTTGATGEAVADVGDAREQAAREAEERRLAVEARMTEIQRLLDPEGAAEAEAESEEAGVENDRG